MKNLVSDVDNLFTKPHKVNPENLEKFKEDVGNVVKEALETSGLPTEKHLRMSNIGTPLRKLWLDKRPGFEQRLPTPADFRKFLFGHIVEQLLVFLIREAGYEITDTQKKVILNETPGTIDGILNGGLFDIKTASKYSFEKYTNYGILKEDSFGYAYQMAGYREGLNLPDDVDVSWIIFNKESGELAVQTYSAKELPNATERIQHIRKAFNSHGNPDGYKSLPYCYGPPVEEPKTGNLRAHSLCSYCEHTKLCYPKGRVVRRANRNVFYAEFRQKLNNPEDELD